MSLLRHFGITVANLDESIEFYRALLGFEVVRIMDEEGEHIDSFSGLRGVKVRTVKMQDGSGNMIELLKYHSHPHEANNDEITRIGCSHFALTVKNLNDLLKKIDEKGYTINSEPQYSPDGKVKLTFCKGPDGVLIELVEELH